MSMKHHLNNPTLNRMVLDHLINGIAGGGHSLADQLGIDARMRRQLVDLRSIEIARLAELRGCIRVEIDVSALSRLLDHLMQEREQEQLVQEFALRNAPQSMLRSLFRLSSREVTALRCSLGLHGAPGRPRQPTEDEERQAWEACQELGLQVGELKPADWLSLQDATGIPLRILWAMVGDWAAPAEVTV